MPLTAQRKGVLAQPRVRIAAIVVIAVVAGVVVWSIARGSSSSSDSTPPKVRAVAPVALSAAGLAALAHTVGQPIYWAGPRQHYLYELHRTTDGNVYIRYLPPGVDAGATGGDYLTVATYPFDGAFDALENVKEGQHIAIPNGGTAVIAPNYKKSIHLAFPKVNYQVEVYEPSASQVLELVRSGRIRPV